MNIIKLLEIAKEKGIYASIQTRADGLGNDWLVSFCKQDSYFQKNNKYDYLYYEEGRDEDLRDAALKCLEDWNKAALEKKNYQLFIELTPEEEKEIFW